jgi:hypothetical protein
MNVTWQRGVGWRCMRNAYDCGKDRTCSGPNLNRSRNFQICGEPLPCSGRYAEYSYAPDNPEWPGYHAPETRGNSRTHAGVPPAFQNRPSRGLRPRVPLRHDPLPSCGACPDRATPRYTLLQATPAGLPRRAGCAARAVGKAWPPAESAGEGAAGAGAKCRPCFLSVFLHSEGSTEDFWAIA